MNPRKGTKTVCRCRRIGWHGGAHASRKTVNPRKGTKTDQVAKELAAEMGISMSEDSESSEGD